MGKSMILVLTGFGLLYALLLTAGMGCDTGAGNKTGKTNTTGIQATYTGSGSCQSCHAKAYADWKKSDHYLAMQPALDSTVLGDFNNTTYVADGVTNRFFKKDSKFYLRTQGEDGNYHDYEVLYAFGHFPLQQYLIAFPGGRMQAARVSWDSRDKKWFHQYAGQKIHHHDWLHWTGTSQNWNTMCASCHSTDLQKNYQYKQDAYQTTWHEPNVGCESCHGPGSAHIGFVGSAEYKDGRRIKNAGFLYARDTTPQVQLNTCAPCHTRKSDLAQTLAHTGELLDDLIPQVISNEFYYADGQIREEDYEYGSFAQSKMFHNQVQCSNCHNPHSGKLLKVGNDLCLNCHKPSYNTLEHHFHPLHTEAAQCVNCHMPAKTFMGVDHRRDHSLRIPRPDQSVVYDTPNACTGCHKDKPARWAADAIKKWYGQTRAYHFSDDLLPGSQLTDKSEIHLVKLLRDTLQPEIARATAAYYLGNLPTRQSADALLRGMQDKKSLVRYYAVKSLQNFPPEVWLSAAYTGLTDRVRAVRIATADLYRRLPQDAVPAATRNAYAAADAENKKYLQYQTDFAVGNVMLADYELQGDDNTAAIAHYLRGLKKDSLMNYARLNLSAAYNRTGKNPEALKTLQEAAAIDPTNERIFYNLGLLQYEMGDIAAARSNFRTAVRLGSQHTGLYYNYGLLLQQQNNFKEAEQILRKGFELDPNAANINYALAYLYMRQNQPKKARIHAEVLHRLDPANPEYQVLFSNLGW